MSESDRRQSQRNANLRVRAADVSDLKTLTEIEALAFASDRLSRRSLRAFVAAPSAALLLAERGAVLGYALVLFRRNSRAARLYSLAVEPGASRTGIGSRLLAAAERAASDRGAASLRLEVRADNAGALRFYERHGYVLFGRRDDYYADGVAALRLQRPLAVVGRSGSTASRSEPLEAVTDG